jgi:tetratricopeptide (TPR) repeat protein
MHTLRTIGLTTCALVAVMAGVLLAPADTVLGQTKTPPPSSAPTTVNRPTNSPSMPSGPTSTPIFLSGRVALDDGSPLPGQVVIERVCNGIPRPEAHTDGKGNFSFQMGQNRFEFADASYSRPMSLGDTSSAGLNPSGAGASTNNNLPSTGPMANNPNSDFALANCEIRAQLSGYRSDTVQLATRRYLDNPDVGTIILHRMGNVTGLTTSAVSLGAPKDARKVYEKGLEALKKDNIDEAQKSFLKAVELYPHYATAWFELGKVYEKRDHWAEARKAFDEAVASDPKYVSPYERIYMLYMREAKWPEVADTTEKLLKLNPYEFPNAYLHNAMANFQLQKYDAAEKSVREGLKVDTAGQYVMMNYILALILAQKQDFPGCAEYLRKYIQLAPNAKNIDAAKKQLAETEQYIQALVGPAQKPKQ